MIPTKNVFLLYLSDKQELFLRWYTHTEKPSEILYSKEVIMSRNRPYFDQFNLFWSHLGSLSLIQCCSALCTKPQANFPHTHIPKPTHTYPLFPSTVPPNILLLHHSCSLVDYLEIARHSKEHLVQTVFQNCYTHTHTHTHIHYFPSVIKAPHTQPMGAPWRIWRPTLTVPAGRRGGCFSWTSFMRVLVFSLGTGSFVEEQKHNSGDLEHTHQKKMLRTDSSWSCTLTPRATQIFDWRASQWVALHSQYARGHVRSAQVLFIIY